MIQTVEAFGGEPRSLMDIMMRLNLDPEQRREFSEKQQQKSKKRTNDIIKQRAKEQKAEQRKAKRK